MVKQVPIGAKGAAEERVQYEHTLTAHHHQLPSILSTAELIRLMETAGYYALQPFCEKGEIPVCTSAQIEHPIPVGINAVVRASAEVESGDELSFRLRVRAFEGKTEIGSGTITLVIVRVAEYLKQNDIPLP